MTFWGLLGLLEVSLGLKTLSLGQSSGIGVIRGLSTICDKEIICDFYRSCFEKFSFSGMLGGVPAIFEDLFNKRELCELCGYAFFASHISIPKCSSFLILHRPFYKNDGENVGKSEIYRNPYLEFELASNDSSFSV